MKLPGWVHKLFVVVGVVAALIVSIYAVFIAWLFLALSAGGSWG